MNTPKPLTLRQLKSLEQHAYRMYEILKEAQIPDGFPLTRDAAQTLWLTCHDAYQKHAIARATRQDKGVELFTVFVPGRNGEIHERRRTPFRRISLYHWPSLNGGPGYDQHPGHIEALGNHFNDPRADFARWMKPTPQTHE